MENKKEKVLNIDTRLASLRFICDNKSHIELDREKCKNCKEKRCLYFCPANVYNEGADNDITVEFENCMECGTCRLSCPNNAIKWNYPQGGHGVRYRFG